MQIISYVCVCVLAYLEGVIEDLEQLVTEDHGSVHPASGNLPNLPVRVTKNDTKTMLPTQTLLFLRSSQDNIQGLLFLS